MNIRVTSILCLLLAMPLLAQDSQEVRRARRNNGKDLVWRVPRAALRGVPAWDPARQEPPLGITAAVRIAQRKTNARFPSRAIITGIELNAFGEQGALRWYYFIQTYNQDEANGPAPPESHGVLVLMNGKIVEPSEERPRDAG